MIAWVEHISTCHEQHIPIPFVMGKCLDRMERYLYAHTHFLDRREAAEMASAFLPELLTVMDRDTTDTECNHQMCRAIVHILGVMLARMNDGIKMNEFRDCPYTTRNDECGLYYRLNWTVENKAQFKVCEATRTQASALINKYLEQMKVDKLDLEETEDVENLVKWVEAGMFMSRVPLTRDDCPCLKCRARRAL